MNHRSDVPDADTGTNPKPVLSDAVQKHLGSLLQAAYNELPTHPPDRFEALLARLDAALSVQESIDEQSFRADLLRAVPSLQKFAITLTRNMTAADDLVQDTLMRAWRSRKSYRIDTNLGAWLFTIMRNHFYSERRKAKQEVADVDGHYASKLASIPEQMGRLDLSDAQRALNALPEIMRQALILVTIENLSYEHAAAVMKCETGTIKSRVSRARQQLARELGFGADEVGVDGRTLSAMVGRA